MRAYKPFQKRYGVWRKWFAWYPVRIENYIIWLEYVERKKDLVLVLNDIMTDYRYRELRSI